MKQCERELNNLDALFVFDKLQPPSFSEEWIGIAHKIIIPLILPWPSSKPRLLGILETSPLSFLNRLNTSCHTFYDPRRASFLTRKSGRTETTQKTSDVLITFALKRLTWTVPRRLLSNKFRASVRSMPYTLSSSRNKASSLDQQPLERRKSTASRWIPMEW